MKNCRISIYLYICEFCQFGGVEQWPWNGTVLKTILPLRTQRTERGWINWNKYDRGMNDLAENLLYFHLLYGHLLYGHLLYQVICSIRHLLYMSFALYSICSMTKHVICSIT